MDNLNTMMPHCRLGNRVTVSGVLFNPDCSDFKPVVTNRGICYAFNAEPLSQFAKQTNFTDAFDEAFNEDMEGDTDSEIRNNLGSGKSFGLEFWLDNQVCVQLSFYLELLATCEFDVFYRLFLSSKLSLETHLLLDYLTRLLRCIIRILITMKRKLCF